MSIKVFLYGMPEQTRVLRQMLSNADEITIAGISSSENEVLDQIRSSKADVMLTYIDGSAPVYRVAQQVYMLCPQCLNFALAPDEVYSAESGKIYKSGIHYVYEDTINEEELASFIKSAYSVEKSRKNALEEGKESTISSRVMTFYSPKSGMGKSTFVMSFAVELAKRKQKVCVLDFDLQFGDINILGNIETKETLSEMLQERSTPTIDIIRQYVTLHKSGVNILCAPRNAEYADSITSHQVDKIISALRTYYDYILVDLGTTINEITYACCENSSKVLMAVRPDISNLNHAKKTIAMLESMGQMEKINLIYFNLPKKSEITPEKTAKVLGAPVWTVVPYDMMTAVDAMNQGEPIATLAPKTTLGKVYAKAAELTIQNAPVGQKKSKGLFRKS